MTEVIAHRGARNLAAENTIEAFRKAVEVGSHGIELDVRRTADGVLVVHHDALLNGDAIVDLAADDLPAWVPTLGAALDACVGAYVNIEIKNALGEPDFDPDDAVADAVVGELSDRREATTTWLISSFRVETIDRCRAVAPMIPTALLTMNRITTADLDAVVASGHAAIHPWTPTVDRELIEQSHAAGLRVNTWTCNDLEQAIELAGWGIDGICTDVPDVMVAALASRP